MYKNKKILAIIPARSGSKGLPDKNIKDLNGKPLITYTIEAALQSGIFEDVMVSTDSEKYAQIAREFGASVPFLRSPENSDDKASSWSVVLEILGKIDKKYDLVMILQPTSPLRTAKNIVEASDLFFEKDANAVVSVSKFPHSINWVNTLPPDLSMDGFVSKDSNSQRRQDGAEHYMLNGAIYLLKANLVSPDINLYTQGTYAYVMEEKESVDIDSELDFALAKVLMCEKTL